MIKGLGIDIVSVERVRQLLERHSGRAKQRLYTDVERDYCEAMANPELHYAARFAAKEAFVKAIGTGFSAGVRWRDIGVVNDPLGKPDLHVAGTAAEKMQALAAAASFVSLSHDPHYAAAVVVLEGPDPS